jgi:hypothetical protein
MVVLERFDRWPDHLSTVARGDVFPMRVSPHIHCSSETTACKIETRPTTNARSASLFTHFSVTREMGQGFRIASPSANEVLHWGGILGEILFDGSAKSIVRLLAVPVRPSKSA